MKDVFRLSAAVLCASTVLCVVSADEIAVVGKTFAWKHRGNHTGSEPPAAPNWQEFGNAANWAVGTVGTEGNPDALIPGASDTIHYGLVNGDYTGKIVSFDLGARTHTVGSFHCPSQWAPYLMLLRNGGLSVSDSFTNNYMQVHVQEGGEFTHGENCTSALGTGSTHTGLHAHEGGRINVCGRILFAGLRMTVADGGVATFSPTRFEFSKNSTADNVSYIRNHGTMDMPAGLTIYGGWTPSGPCVFTFEQMDGVLNLGGGFVRDVGNSSDLHNNKADFVLGGGTVNATADVAFTEFRRITMFENAVAAVNVAAGKTLDLSGMIFGPGTVLEKGGEGILKLGASAPDRLDVVGGTVLSAAATKFGEISFSEGTSLKLNAAGVSAKDFTGIAGASIMVADEILSSGLPILTIEDEEAAAEAATKMGDAPEGFAYTANGGTVTLEKPHEGNVFYWKKEGNAGYWSFYDPSLWGVGKTIDSANDNGWLPGEDDEIYYGNAYNRYLYFDMKGGKRKIKGLSDGLNPAQEKWGFCNIKVRNGTLEFVSSFTNGRAKVTVDNAGRFILGERCGTQMGFGGMQNTYAVNNGGECVIGGYVSMHVMQAEIHKGGRLCFKPTDFAYESTVSSANQQSFILNSGFMELPDGIELSGASKGGCTFTIAQYGGEMLLGGDIEMLSAVDSLDFVLTGGVVRVVNDAAFIGCRNVVMTNDANAEISVAAEKLADFSAMAFEDGTVLTKSGPGSFKLGESAPDALSVSEGRLIVGGAASFGAGLSLGAGTVLHFAAAGASAESIAGLDDATVTVDRATVKYGAALFASPDEDFANAMAEKLTPAVKAATGSCRTLAVAPSEAGVGFLLKVVSNCGLRIILR